MTNIHLLGLLLLTVSLGCQSQNLIGSLQNPPTTLAVPSSLIPGDIRFAVNLTVNTFIRSGFKPSTAIELQNSQFPQRLYTGYRSIEAQDPIDENTIFRIASMSKMVTALTVLQYEEQGLISLDDRVSKYIPAFGKATVAIRVMPTIYEFATIELVAGSSEVIINLPYLSANEITKLHKKQCGIQITGALPGVNLNGIFTVVKFSPHKLTVTVDLQSESTVTGLFNVSGLLEVLPKLRPHQEEYDYVLVPSNASNPFQRARAYYTTEPSQPLTIRHLLTHTAGIGYGSPGVNSNSLQTAIMLKRDPSLVRFSLNPNLDFDAVEWAERFSNIPMLFQPGTDWYYGPQIGIAGAVLMAFERSRGSSLRTLYEIQNAVLFSKLNITSAGYFILDSDPQRDYKISHLARVYTNLDTTVFSPPVWTVTSLRTSIVINGLDFALPGLQGAFADGAIPTVEGAANTLHPIYGSGTPRKLELGDAGLYMTTNDFKKIVVMLAQNGSYQGEQIVQSQTVQKMFTNQIGELFIEHPIAPAGNVKWGYGVAVGDDSLSTDPLDKISGRWAGAFGSWWYVDVATGNSFVLNSNILPIVNYQSLINSIVGAIVR